ncbi:transglutaminase-like cysteine peptidase [Neoaquamicrobium sediminum]|uniref:Transglutaminase-like cysteine peptidase n=1 Tax=Neoaquamicrobium sediminum TaxID=1849104 RepID=A0ABV3WN14_9HYPH
MNATLGRWRLWPLAAAVMFLAATTGTMSEASGVGAMATGGLTSQPIGHYEFCRANPSECSSRLRDRGPIVLTDALRRVVIQVNLDVNRAVKPMSDFDIYGKDEVWAYPDQGVGDCEDYALEKRRQLAAKGIPLSNLLVTVVRKLDGEGHAVLTLRTDRGDFILDNLSDELRPWQKTGYRYLKRQASTHTGRWVTLREDQNMLVGALE